MGIAFTAKSVAIVCVVDEIGCSITAPFCYQWIWRRWIDSSCTHLANHSIGTSVATPISSRTCICPVIRNRSADRELASQPRACPPLPMDRIKQLVTERYGNQAWNHHVDRLARHLSLLKDLHQQDYFQSVSTSKRIIALVSNDQQLQSLCRLIRSG